MRFVTLFTLSIFIHLFVAGQTYDEQVSSPSQFDKFIYRPNIEYAFYADDTVHFSQFNLSHFLVEKMQNLKIVGAEPIWARSLSANHIHYYNKNNLEYLIYEQRDWEYMYDSLGNKINSLEPAPVRRYNEKDSNINTRLNITQIYYVKNGKLRSHIPWIGPVIPVITSSGIFLGNTEYFSTCINLNPDFKSSTKDKLINLESTKRRINLDSIQKSDKLKELYGRNLAETIWAGLIEGKNIAYDLKSGKKLSAYQVKNYSFTPPIIREIFDTIFNRISPSIFKEIQISQNWSYNATKNILTSTIPEIILYAKRENENEVSPIIKVIFK